MLLAAFQRIYLYGSSKQLKSQIPTRICQEYDLNRKYVTKRLNQIDRPKKESLAQQSSMTLKFLLEPLKEIWVATDFMCGQRLKEAMPLWLPFYELHVRQLPASVKKELLKMSLARINRMLQPIKLKTKRRGWCGTKPGELLKNHIAIKIDHWDVTQPGFIEADTLVHCGNSTAGDVAEPNLSFIFVSEE